MNQLTTLEAIRSVLEEAGINVQHDRFNVTKASGVVIQLPELSFLELDHGWSHAHQSNWPLDCMVTYDKNGKHVAKSIELTNEVLEAFREAPDLNGAPGICDAVPLTSSSPFFASNSTDGNAPLHYVRTITLKITHDGGE